MTDHTDAERVKELRWGIEVLIEKLQYDEYGSATEQRERAIATAKRILEADEKGEIA